MMRSLELSRHRRANVWLDEAPPADFNASSVRTLVVKPIRAVSVTRQVVGLEVRIPHGPRVLYGLLGAELTAADVDGLEVAVSVNNLGFRLQSSLALQPDEVMVGLLDEYASAVVSGAAKVAETIGAPTRAKLWFRWAAHGRVGSSPSVFEAMSAIAFRLLMLPKDAGDEQLEALFA